MKPFARIILAVSLVLAAAGAEWSIIRYRIPIQEFVFYNSSYVWGVRVALMVIGGVIIALAAALAVARRAFHRKCGIEIVSDRVALRGIAVAMLFVFVLCLTLAHVAWCDVAQLEATVMSCFVWFGSIVAIRAKRKWWIFVYFLIWMFAGLLLPM